MVNQAKQCLMNMELVIVVSLLVSLCSATSPPFPYIVSLDCNETQVQTDLAMDLINEHRDEGFILRPVRVKSVVQQESVKIRGGFIYYLDLDVMETDFSVLSGKSWKESTHDIPMHETVFGHCKAVVFIARTWRILKLITYNCTLATVPAKEIVMMCPDCPVLLINITPDIKAKADRLVQKFNEGSNETHLFKVDDIERVRTQYVFGQSYFILFTIEETECLKTQTNVNLADCKSLKDHEAHVGFCKGTIYHKPDGTEGLDVACEIYDPTDDHDHHRHSHCDHGPDRSKAEQGQEKSNADETKVKQEGNGEAGQGEAAPGRCGHHKHGRCPHHRGHRRHHCRHPHHHHHHHHHSQLNDSVAHDPSHHHHHHHDHHDHHNHTTSNDGSSSEEHTDKRFEKRSKGSVQFYHLSDEKSSVPVPTIVRLPSPPEIPGKPPKHDNIEFPSEPSHLETCPGEPLINLPIIVKNHLFT